MNGETGGSATRRLVDTDANHFNPELGACRQAGLMVALLLRYPEIGSVRVLPRTASVTLAFWLYEAPAPDEYQRFRLRLGQGLRMFSWLEGHGYSREAEISLRGQGPLHRLDVRRDLESLVAEEFPIIVGLVRQSFDELLVIDGEAYAEEGDDEETVLSIARGLDEARSVRQGDELVGFRQDGRVLVFSAA